MSHHLTGFLRHSSILALVLLGGACGGEVEVDDPDLALPETRATLQPRGEILIWSAPPRPARTPGSSFFHKLEARLPGEREAQLWTRRGRVGDCEVLEQPEDDAAAEVDHTPALQQDGGRIDVLPTNGGDALLSLPWNQLDVSLSEDRPPAHYTPPAGYTAVAQDFLLWNAGAELIVRAAGADAATPGGIAPFEARVRQSSPVTVIEPSLTPADRPSPLSPTDRLHRSVKVRRRADMVVRWAGAHPDDEIMVVLGGWSTAVTGEARPRDPKKRWARCHGKGSELIVPRAAVEAVRRVATGYCTFNVSSRTVTEVMTSTGLPVDIVTSMTETAAGPALVEFE